MKDSLHQFLVSVIRQPDRDNLWEKGLSFGSRFKGTAHHGGKARQQELELMVTLMSWSRNRAHWMLCIAHSLYFMHTVQDLLLRKQSCTQSRWVFPCNQDAPPRACQEVHAVGDFRLSDGQLMLTITLPQSHILKMVSLGFKT